MTVFEYNTTVERNLVIAKQCADAFMENIDDDLKPYIFLDAQKNPLSTDGLIEIIAIGKGKDAVGCDYFNSRWFHGLIDTYEPRVRVIIKGTSRKPTLKGNTPKDAAIKCALWLNKNKTEFFNKFNIN